MSTVHKTYLGITCTAALFAFVFACAWLGEERQQEFKLACIQAGKSVVGFDCVQQ